MIEKRLPTEEEADAKRKQAAFGELEAACYFCGYFPVTLAEKVEICKTAPEVERVYRNIHLARKSGIFKNSFGYTGEVRGKSIAKTQLFKWWRESQNGRVPDWLQSTRQREAWYLARHGKDYQQFVGQIKQYAKQHRRRGGKTNAALLARQFTKNNQLNTRGMAYKTIYKHMLEALKGQLRPGVKAG